MKKINPVCIIALILTLSCNQEPVDKISGTYVRESTKEEKNPETMKVLGRSYLRDTIFIIPNTNGYRVENSKWKRNDFDSDGWRDQAHSDNRPLSDYTVTFDKADQTLNPEEALTGKTLYLDLEKGFLYKNSKKDDPWIMIPKQN